MDIKEYLQIEHPEILEEYKRYLSFLNMNLQRGTKFVSLVSGYGGFSGQELILMDCANYNGKSGLSLSDVRGNRYVCYYRDLHKDLKV